MRFLLVPGWSSRSPAALTMSLETLPQRLALAPNALRQALLISSQETPTVRGGLEVAISSTFNPFHTYF